MHGGLGFRRRTALELAKVYRYQFDLNVQFKRQRWRWTSLDLKQPIFVHDGAAEFN